MQTTSIIRDRGQLTIPDSIRQSVTWVGPMSAVVISVVRPDEIVIRPHTQKLDMNQIWENIRKSRDIVGQGRVSTIDFLTADRSAH